MPNFMMARRKFLAVDKKQTTISLTKTASSLASPEPAGPSISILATPALSLYGTVSSTTAVTKVIV